MTNNKTGSKKYFDNISNKWDKMQQSFFSDEVKNKAFKVANIQKSKTAADIGCGSGYITSSLLQKGLKVVAFDQSEKMLDILKKKFKNSELKCIQSNYDNLKFPPESVDYAFANMYLHHVEEPEVAIKEMVRILKKGGKIVITDLDTHSIETLRTEQFDRWLGFDRKIIQTWYKNAGLKKIIVDCVGSNCGDCSNGKDIAISIFYAYGEKH